MCLHIFIDIFAFKSLNTILYANEVSFHECHGVNISPIDPNDIRLHGPTIHAMPTSGLSSFTVGQ